MRLFGYSIIKEKELIRLNDLVNKHKKMIKEVEEIEKDCLQIYKDEKRLNQFAQGQLMMCGILLNKRHNKKYFNKK